MDGENEGSLLLGIVLGFFLGCIGIVVAFVLKGSRTLTGSVIGVVLQIALSVCASFALVLLQILLSNA